MGFSNEQWRNILELSEAVADLPPEEQLQFLQSANASAEVIEEVLSLAKNYEVRPNVHDRIGTCIGRFTITGYLGSGGAGDVYSAVDIELQRTVALKILKSKVEGQNGAIERFLREARTVSALNDPYIVIIHEIIRSEPKIAMVMEFVEGRSLRQICGSPVELKDVVRIGDQIAQALAAAHSAGIVHRDVKPENVILREDGSVKVLDFGLATSLGARPEDGDSVSQAFAGTWRYMSPEQARGDAITSACDIYSLGLLLRELYTGLLPFAEEESPEQHRAVPKPLAKLLQTMLAEDPHARPSAVSAGEALRRIGARYAGTPRTRSRASVGSLSILGLLSALIIVIFLHHSSPPSFRAPVLLPLPISVEPGSKSGLAFSPDGKRLSYIWAKPESVSKIYVQQIDAKSGNATQPSRLSHLDGAETSSVWAPDNRTVAFVSEERGVQATIKLLDAFNGSERKLTDFDHGKLLAWTADGKWLLASVAGRIVLISTGTGARRVLTDTFLNGNDTDPAFSPSGRTLAFVHYSGGVASQLAELRLDPNYLPVGSPRLFGWANFSPTRLASPIWINERELLFVAMSEGVPRIWRSADHGQPELVSYFGENISSIALSPQRHMIAYTKNLDDTNIWKLDLTRARPSNPEGGPAPAAVNQARTQVISSSRMDQRPSASPDGTRLAFESNRGGFTEIWVSNLQSGKTWQLTNLKGFSGSPRWSHDSKWIVFDSRSRDTSHVFKIPSVGGTPVRLTQDRGVTDCLPVWSADGKSIYFSSNRSGTFQVWRIASDGGDPTRLTQGAGTAPETTADGKFLYYLKGIYDDADLWRRSLSNADEIMIARQVLNRGVVVAKDRLYFISRDGSSTVSLWMRRGRGNQPYKIADLPSTLVGGLSISPDQRFLYYAQLDHSGDELMLANGFESILK